jgi:hypothetical protein
MNMEKLRASLEVLKKYHFWILCGLIVILAFVSWFLATSDEQRRFSASKSTIENQFGLVDKIAANKEHPSPAFIAQIKERESGSLTNLVANASTRLYTEQRNANPLPKVFADPKDQHDFEVEFDKIWGPIEKIEKLPHDKLAELYRNRYRDHIEDHFPTLFKLIERRTMGNPAQPAASETRPMRQQPFPPGLPGRGQSLQLRGSRGPAQPVPSGQAGDDATVDGIVDWVDADAKISAFLSRYAGNTTPTTLDIAMAQEDLWVYEALLKVIRFTNDIGPDPKHLKDYMKPASHKSARIKQILAMDIGSSAVDSWSRSESSLFTAPGEVAAIATGPGSVQPPAAQPAAGPPSRVERGGVGTGAGVAGVSPLVGRYVDDKGKPLTDPAEQLPLIPEYRMMPITLKVVIEQNAIPRLLAECANSAMRIDVRRVRILQQEPPPVDLNADPAAANSATGTTTEQQPPPPPIIVPAGSRHGSLLRGPMGAQRGPMPGVDSGGPKSEMDLTEESLDPTFPPVPVEVQGIIYIYNPPQVKKADDAGTDNGGTGAPANGTATTNNAGPGGINPVPSVTAPPTGTPASGGRP